MTVTLYRSNIEAAKRLFLDRLTTGAQPLLQPTAIDQGPGDPYYYGGVGDSNNFGVSFDCSGLAGVAIATALYGFNYWAGIGYQRLFSTETFVNWAATNGNWKQTTQADLVNGDYPIKVMIMHGGGGPDSHMACWIDGWNMESNGDYGVCTAAPEITGVASNFWNDWWVWTGGPISEDTKWRQPMEYPQGLDYAGGQIPGEVLAQNGIQFVCRYINDGGTGLPKKLLTADEFVDLVQNGIRVHFNYETTSDFMLSDNGAADAQTGLAYVQGLLSAAAQAGLNVAGYDPVIYFSADFDEPPEDDAVLDAFLDSAKGVLGVNSSGKSCAAAYGAYWFLMRANNSGHVDYLWQTEAWSGGNIDSAIAIMQRNDVGYATYAGVQCDVDEAHADDTGAFIPDATPIPAPVPVPVPTPAPAPVSNPYANANTPDGGNYAALGYSQMSGPLDAATGYGTGWTQLGDGPTSAVLTRTIVDYLARYKPLWDSQLAALNTPTPPTGLAARLTSIFKKG